MFLDRNCFNSGCSESLSFQYKHIIWVLSSYSKSLKYTVSNSSSILFFFLPVPFSFLASKGARYIDICCFLSGFLLLPILGAPFYINSNIANAIKISINKVISSFFIVNDPQIEYQVMTLRVLFYR